MLIYAELYISCKLFSFINTQKWRWNCDISRSDYSLSILGSILSLTRVYKTSELALDVTFDISLIIWKFPWPFNFSFNWLRSFSCFSYIPIIFLFCVFIPLVLVELYEFNVISKGFLTTCWIQVLWFFCRGTNGTICWGLLFPKVEHANNSQNLNKLVMSTTKHVILHNHKE